MADDLTDQVRAEHISVDDGKHGPGINHRITWRETSRLNSEWTVVLEDDAAPVDDFLDQINLALPAAPTPIISLYLGKIRPPQWQGRISTALDRADEADANWIVSDHLLHAVGVAIRTELVWDMTKSLLFYIPIDEAIGRWARKRGHRICYTNPSLVDHYDVPTLVRHQDGATRTPGRVAWRTGSRLVWDTTTVGL